SRRGVVDRADDHQDEQERPDELHDVLCVLGHASSSELRVVPSRLQRGKRGLAGHGGAPGMCCEKPPETKKNRWRLGSPAVLEKQYSRTSEFGKHVRPLVGVSWDTSAG